MHGSSAHIQPELKGPPWDGNGDGNGRPQLTFRVVEGPISDDRLQIICDLYGRNVDFRYQDMDFVRTVFNGNPAGRSFHVFAIAGEKAVGCYAVIPVKVIARGREIWAGKGEAFYVQPEYRPSGVFMISRAKPFLEERGIKLLFGLTRERVGTMLKGLGYTALPFVLKQRLRLIRPDDIEQLTGSSVRRFSAHKLMMLQSLAERVATVLLHRSGPFIEVNRRDHLEVVFSTLAKSEVCRDCQWSASTNEESLRWWNRIGRFDVLTIDGNASEFVAVTKGVRGGSAAILSWNLRDGGTSYATHVLKFILQKAKAEDAAGVSFSRNSETCEQGAFSTAAGLLGFVPWRAHRTMYVKSADPFFLDPRNLNFNRFFSI